jgi:hypothetical protein
MCRAIADAELGGDVPGGDPGVRCAEASDDEAVADLPGALPRIAEASWWSVGTGQHEEELPPIRPLVVTVSGKRRAASSVGVRSGVVIRGRRLRRCVRRRPRRVPLHGLRHLVIRHRVLVEETHVAITAPPTRPVVAGSHQATARPAPRGD